MAFLRSSCFLILGAAAFCLHGGQVDAAELGTMSAALELIDLDGLRNHAATLASDTLEGREAGSRGGQAAGTYIVEQLRKYPVEPAGTEGSFFQYFGSNYRNILAVLPGSDPDLRGEYILVGAHYDHVGYGNWSNSLGGVGRIHNGADDNGSGTAGLLETIEALSSLSPRPKRSILFAFFDGEEKGLLGSRHWKSNPTRPLPDVRFMVNVDMIGRMRNDLVEVFGVRTTVGLRRRLSEQNRDLDLRLAFNWDNVGNSDHYPFFVSGIPYIMLHTQKHDDYHRPSDDVDKLNLDGMQQATRLLFRLAASLANDSELGNFRGRSIDEGESTRDRLSAAPEPGPPRLGVSWDIELAKEQIIKLTSVRPGSPASNAGLKIDDRVLEFGGHPIDDKFDFRTLVLAAENATSIVVNRSDQEDSLTLDVQLNGDPKRVGIRWRTDNAEPDTLIVTAVAPGSPADMAGLRPSDRVYSVSGQSITTIEEFQAILAKSQQKNELELTVESLGRIRNVHVKLLPELASINPEALPPAGETNSAGE